MGHTVAIALKHAVRMDRISKRNEVDVQSGFISWTKLIQYVAIWLAKPVSIVSGTGPKMNKSSDA